MAKEQEAEVINKIFEDLGIGKYQLLTIVFILIPTIFNFMSQNTFVFSSRDTSYRCLIPECENSSSSFNQSWIDRAIPFRDGAMDKCNRYVSLSYNASMAINDNISCDLDNFDNKTTVKCSEWIYGDGETIVKDFNIPCESWKRSLVQSLNRGGFLLSLLFSGVLSDKYGRRMTMIALMFIGSVIATIQTFSPNYLMFSAFEFLNTGISSGAYSVAYVLMAESLPVSKRIYGCTLMEIFNTLSVVVVGILAWVSPTWKDLLRLVNIPLLAVPLVIFIIPESIRWLYAKGKKQECVNLYKRAAKINGSVASEHNLKELENVTAELIAEKTSEIINEVSLSDLLKSKCMMLRLLLCSFCWFSNLLAYDGLSINSVNVEGNDGNAYLNFILVTLIEMPSILLYFLFLKYFKRRVGLCISYIGAGAFCIAYGAATNLNESIRFSMYLFGKFFMNICLASNYVYSSEMFPTVFRSFSLNFCCVFGYIGSMLTPQLLLLDEIHKSLPMFIFGGLSILSAFCIYKLPETKGKNVPDTLEEAEKL